MPDIVEWDVRYGRNLRTIAMIFAVAVSFLGCGVLILLLIHTGFSFWQDSIKDHLLGSVGFTGILSSAFTVVIFLRQSEGPIEFEALGMKFKGAAGQVVLWCVCVIVLSLCAKLLW
jgi:hypothetical protein